jgi:hypothetical protein
MADHFALVVSGHHGNELAALDLVPVAADREHLRMDVVMAVDFKEAAGDCRRIALLRQVDETVTRCRRRGGRRRRWLGRGHLRLGSPGQAAVKADLPPIDSVFVA